MKQQKKALERIFILIVLIVPFFAFSQSEEKNYRAELVATFSLDSNFYRKNVARTITVYILDSKENVLKILEPKSYRAILIRNNEIIIDTKEKSCFFSSEIDRIAVKGDICIVMDVKLKDRKYKLPEGSVLVLYPRSSPDNNSK